MKSVVEIIKEQPKFCSYTNLASGRLGAEALLCSDDFFAEMQNLVLPGRGIFIADKYTDRGKWMDGWESRRKRTEGHDWCIVKLATHGIIHGLDIDTNYFLGNHPPFASVEACTINTKLEATSLNDDTIQWKEILPKVALDAGSQNFFEIADKSIYTHLKLHIYPDGGVARLKVYGEVVKDWKSLQPDEIVDLASALNGAKSVLCNDMFFSHMDNLLLPGRGINMGDGWETKRNRTPNNRDWVIVRLAHAGTIKQVLIDTCHFKGNYPDACMIEGTTIKPEDETKLTSTEINWTTVLPKVKLNADFEHYFEKEVENHGPFTHVRLSIFPDGGISRMRLFGNAKL
ncbi:MAG TPA: allantoicase [Bacteroidia bacterium]|nr:allantoicase [Bacteroidia bacterium]